MTTNNHELEELGELIKLFRAKNWRLAVGIASLLLLALIALGLAADGTLTTDIFSVFVVLGIPGLYFFLKGWFIRDHYFAIYENGLAIVQHKTDMMLTWDNIDSVKIERKSKNPLIYLLSFWFLLIDLLLGTTTNTSTVWQK